MESENAVRHVYPKTLCNKALSGAYGCSKTTLARIFARAMNCDNLQKSDPCLDCDFCLQPIDQSSYYYEYDASVVGGVDGIRQIREEAFLEITGVRKVVVFDEFHLVTRAGQSALLKAIEEIPKSIWVLFATPDTGVEMPACCRA